MWCILMYSGTVIGDELTVLFIRVAPVQDVLFVNINYSHKLLSVQASGALEWSGGAESGALVSSCALLWCMCVCGKF